jgi:L-threonylcarbamoyladenylate synthase
MQQDIEKALNLLSAGEVVAFPTETVYGLGADATQSDAVKKIYTLKNRPSFNPLIIHVFNLEQAQKYGVFSELALKLAKEFWPGPLTLVVPLLPNTPIVQYVTAGLNTIAIRCPNHPVALALLEQYQNPLAAPSANISGYVSPTKASHVVDEFGEKVFVLPGGKSNVGLESTIVDCASEELSVLRPGFVTRDQIEAITGVAVFEKTTFDVVTAPGQLKHHYAPKTNVKINATEASGQDVCLNFGQSCLLGGAELNLSVSGSLEEAAANLFDYLRQADQISQARGYAQIVVAPIPNEGLGVAINERLQRAATEKHTLA